MKRTAILKALQAFDIGRPPAEETAEKVMEQEYQAKIKTIGRIHAFLQSPSDLREKSKRQLQAATEENQQARDELKSTLQD